MKLLSGREIPDDAPFGSVEDEIGKIFDDTTIPMTAAEVRWHLDFLTPQPTIAKVRGVLAKMVNAGLLRTEKGQDYARCAKTGEFLSGTRLVNVTWYTPTWPDKKNDR